jgi:hypothetical protein
MRSSGEMLAKESMIHYINCIVENKQPPFGGPPNHSLRRDIGDVLKTLVEHCKGKVLNIFNTQSKELERYIRVICNCKVQNCYTIAEIRCSLYLGLTKKISFSCLSKSYEYGVPITTLKRYKDKIHYDTSIKFSQMSLYQFNHYCHGD